MIAPHELLLGKLFATNNNAGNIFTTSGYNNVLRFVLYRGLAAAIIVFLQRFYDLPPTGRLAGCIDYDINQVDILRSETC